MKKNIIIAIYIIVSLLLFLASIFTFVSMIKEFQVLKLLNAFIFLIGGILFLFFADKKRKE
ncbi:MAG: hypothetical protein RSE07_00680 [Oscillospiraceae bacterium]